jgi:hypothetical protein
MFTRQYSAVCDGICTEKIAQVKQAVRRLGLNQQISDYIINGTEQNIRSRQK